MQMLGVYELGVQYSLKREHLSGTAISKSTRE